MVNSKAVILVGALAVSGAASADLNKGLVAYYPFDGNANDMSGKNNNGVLHGGVSLTTDHNGKVDGAYSFNGVDGFISASANNLPSAARTVVILFKANSLNTMPVLLGYGGDYSCGTSWFMGLNAGPSIYNDSYYVTSHCDVNTFTKKYSPNSVIGHWIQLAISTNAKGTIIYINGVKAASNTNFISNTFVQNKDMAIGVDVSPGGFAPYTDGNVGYFDGVIDDVRIYNRALSASEVQQLYYQAFPPTISGTAVWKTNHTVTCQNITQGTEITLPATTKDGWNCEAAGLQFNSGDTARVIIDGKKY